MSLPTTYVLGIGNVLMGDDGFGPCVADAFDAEYVVGPSVEVVDLGTPGLDISPWLADASWVILVDTVRADAPPGTLRVYDKADIIRYAPGPRIGPHEPSVKAALLALEFAGRAPRSLMLVGVVPECVAQGLELSPAVAQAVDPAVALIASQLRRWRQPVSRRLTRTEFRKTGSPLQNIRNSH